MEAQFAGINCTLTFNNRCRHLFICIQYIFPETQYNSLGFIEINVQV